MNAKPTGISLPSREAYDAAMDPILLRTSHRFTTPYTMRFRMFKMYVWACTNAASNDMYSYSKDMGTPHIRNKKTTNHTRNDKSIYQKTKITKQTESQLRTRA